MTTFTLDSTALVSLLERDIRVQLESGADPLSLDLGDVTRLDVGTMLLCAALAGSRVRAGRDVVLRLPREQEGRDFLRAWNFQGAVEAATELRLRHLVHPDDREHFGETPQHFVPQLADVTGGIGGVASIVARLEAERFFAISTYPLGDDSLITAMIQPEWSRWRQHLFLEGLGPHLEGPRHDVARVVVHEMLANAAQHPDARVAMIGATVADGELAIALWDDGTSIVDTLRACLDAGQNLRAMGPPMAETFDVDAIGWDRDLVPLDSSYQPGPSAADGELLIASLMAGISRKPWRAVPTVERPEHGDWDGYVGYGLYALYRSVINDFCGVLNVRTHGHALELRAGEGPHHYFVRVERYAGQPDFPGNMIVVRLPIAV
jgi:hypothetical protein